MTLFLPISDLSHRSAVPEMEDELVNRSTTVMSYNIDSEKPEAQVRWTERRSVIAQIIRSKRPEIIGVQESTPSQTNWLANNIIGYDYYSLSRDNGKYWQETCPIFYNKRAYKKIDQGSFWLSGQQGNDDQSAKTVNWLKLEHFATKKVLHVFNTQFNNSDQNRRIESARLLKERVEGIVSGGTYIILGDLASEPGEEPVPWMTTWVKDSQESCLVNTTSVEHTYHGWQGQSEEQKRVDYVLLSMDIPANSHEIVDVRYKDTYPSDHLPVFCRLRLQ